MLGRRGFPLEVACASVWRNRSTCLHERFRAGHGLADEVVADGLTAFRGAQLAIDTTLVSALRRDGTARLGAATRAGVALAAARRKKERTYPELTGEGGRARLVVLAAEVGGRLSAETAQFLVALSNAKAESVSELLRGRVAAAWLRLLACSAAKAFAQSLLGRQAPGCGDNIPSEAEVVRDDRFA